MAAFTRASTMKQRYARSSVPYRCFTLTGSDSPNRLVGAMDDDDARRILELVPQADYRRISANHVVHVYRPRQFIRAVLEFARDVRNGLRSLRGRLLRSGGTHRPGHSSRPQPHSRSQLPNQSSPPRSTL